MLDFLAKTWPLLAMRGLAAIVFGALTVAWPELTLDVLVVLYGAFVLIDGVFAIVAVIAVGAAAARWWLLTTGLAGVAAGVLTLLWPGITALVLLWLIAAWAIVTGLMHIVAAVRLRKDMPGEWRLILGGLLSAAFGVLLYLQPVAGALAVTLTIGVYAILYGVLLVAFAVRVRRYARTAERPSALREHRTA